MLSIKINDYKKLVQNIVFSSKSSRFTNDEIIEKFPELVKVSRKSNLNLTVYRILMLEQNQKVNDFGTESTSKSISSCLNIADQMPQLLWGRDNMISLHPTLFKFNIPSENIYLDYDAIMPIIEKRLEKQKDHSVYDKRGNPIKIGDAIRLYKESDEKEVIADLSNLDYIGIDFGVGFSTFSGKIISKAFENNDTDFVYQEYAESWIENIKPILTESELKKSQEWLSEIKQNLDIKKILENKNRSKRKKRTAKNSR